MPQAPAPDLQAPLLQTLQALGAPGMSASKAPFIQGGIGRIEGRVADSKLREAQAEGKFPLSFSVVEHRPEWSRRHRRRHRDSCERRGREPEHRVRSRSQPHGLADVEAVAHGVDVGCRLGSQCTAPHVPQS